MSDLLILFAIAAVAGIAVTLQSSFMGTMTQVLGTRESIFITYGSGGLLIGLIMLLARGAIWPHGDRYPSTPLAPGCWG